MRKLLNILTFLLVLSLIYAHSCAEENDMNNNEDTLLTKSRDSIRSEFEKDSASDKDFFAFETTATQKLSDFADYFNVIADTTIDLPFRIKTGEMIRKIFVSDSVHVGIDKATEKLKTGSLGQLIQSCLENRSYNTQILFDSIRTGVPFRRINPDSYSATLFFAQNLKTGESSGFQNIPHKKEVDVLVEKQEKIFGTDTLKVWNVRLGEIR